MWCENSRLEFRITSASYWTLRSQCALSPSKFWKIFAYSPIYCFDLQQTLAIGNTDACSSVSMRCRGVRWICRYLMRDVVHNNPLSFTVVKRSDSALNSSRFACKAGYLHSLLHAYKLRLSCTQTLWPWCNFFPTWHIGLLSSRGQAMTGGSSNHRRLSISWSRMRL